MVKNNNFKLYTLTELNSAISRLSYDKAVGIDALQDTMLKRSLIKNKLKIKVLKHFNTSR